jgi:hypothetical protein
MQAVSQACGGDSCLRSQPLALWTTRELRPVAETCSQPRLTVHTPRLLCPDDSTSMKYADNGERIDDLKLILERVSEVFHNSYSSH